jgi:hypothetical protein
MYYFLHCSYILFPFKNHCLYFQDRPYTLKDFERILCYPETYLQPLLFRSVYPSEPEAPVKVIAQDQGITNLWSPNIPFKCFHRKSGSPSTLF